MRKQLFLLVLLCTLVYDADAKNHYFSSCYSKVVIEDGEDLVQDSSFLNDMALSPSDNRFTIFVMHDSLTHERVSAIRRQKAAIAFSSIAMAAGAVSSVTSAAQTPLTPLDAKFQMMNYQNGLLLVGSAAELASLSTSELHAQSELPITVVIRNNSDKELCVNDMSRGLLWYIRAYGDLALSVGNPEVNKFRVAYADSTEPHVSYLLVEGCNAIYLENLDFEDSENEYYLLSDKYEGYSIVTNLMRRNKTTLEISYLKLSRKEYQNLKASCK